MGKGQSRVIIWWYFVDWFPIASYKVLRLLAFCSRKKNLRSNHKPAWQPSCSCECDQDRLNNILSSIIQVGSIWNFASIFPVVSAAKIFEHIDQRQNHSDLFTKEWLWPLAAISGYLVKNIYQILFFWLKHFLRHPQFMYFPI